MFLPVFLLTCPEREAACADTLAAWARTDWGNTPPEVYCNPDADPQPAVRIMRGMATLLRRGIDTGAPHFLIIEDDCDFHPRLLALVRAWPPLRSGTLHFGSLYDPGVPFLSVHPAAHITVAHPRDAFGSQARIYSHRCAEHILHRLHAPGIRHDLQCAHLADDLGPLYYHRPSLVQHRPVPSTWNGPAHSADSFDPEWEGE